VGDIIVKVSGIAAASLPHDALLAVIGSAGGEFQIEVEVPPPYLSSDDAVLLPRGPASNKTVTRGVGEPMVRCSDLGTLLQASPAIFSPRWLGVKPGHTCDPIDASRPSLL
jgi:hypothetical protein